MGSNTLASGLTSTAMGTETTASGDYSTAIGTGSTASGILSTSIGFGTKAQSFGSTAIGSFNVGGGNPSVWLDTDPLFEIGKGTGDANRVNAMTVFKDGTVEMSGFKLPTGASNGYVLTSDATGTGSWQIYDGGWQISGDDMHSNVLGNVGIGTTTPTVKLDIEGNLKVNGSVTIATTTRYWSVHSSCFQPLDNEVEHKKFSGYIANKRAGTKDAFVVPVHLPHGAVVREMHALLYDDGADSCEVSLACCYDYSTEYIFTVISEGATPNRVLYMDDSPRPGWDVVDNLTYSYLVVASLPGCLVEPPPQRLYTVRIVYDINHPLP
jgi:hypothetical protein